MQCSGGTLPRFDCVVCGKSAYPPRLSLIADIPSQRLGAITGREQVQRNDVRAWTLLNHLLEEALLTKFLPRYMIMRFWIGLLLGLFIGVSATAAYYEFWDAGTDEIASQADDP
jgi:hypothetical protein